MQVNITQCATTLYKVAEKNTKIFPNWLYSVSKQIRSMEISKILYPFMVIYNKIFLYVFSMFALRILWYSVETLLP